MWKIVDDDGGEFMVNKKQYMKWASENAVNSEHLNQWSLYF